MTSQNYSYSYDYDRDSNTGTEREVSNGKERVTHHDYASSGRKWKMRRHHMHHHWGSNPFRPWGGGAITIMILGFIFAFPLGLLALAYNIWGNWMFKNSYEWNNWSPKMDKWFKGASTAGGTNNNAFEEYKTATLKRLEEEEREFMDFMADLRASKDRQEFDNFMNQRKGSGATEQG